MNIMDMLPASVVPTLKVVPFSDWDEWIYVRNLLLSASTDEQWHGIEIVKLWRSRGNVPHSVDLTAQLLEIRLNDPHTTIHSSNGGGKRRRPTIDSHQLRLLYSISILRAVNGLVDPGQQSYFAQSVLLLADRLGLPGWIVELRHDSTHKQLPSLSVLRAASDYMITWYKNNYWEPQLHYLQSLSQACIPNFEAEEGNWRAWMNRLLKNCHSHCFLIDFFIPIFITALISGPYSHAESLKDEYSAADREFKQQESKWMTIVDRISSEHTTLWIHAAICRLLLTAQDLLKRSTSDSLEVKFRLNLIKLWLQRFIKVIEDKASASKFEHLHMDRVYFTESLIQQLESVFAKHDKTYLVERKEIFERIRDYLSLVYTAGGELKGPLLTWWEQDSVLSAAMGEIASNNKKTAKQITKQPTTIEPATKRIKYSDLGKESLNRIVTVDDMPLWPIGCVPGQYQNVELLKLRVVSKDY